MEQYLAMNPDFFSRRLLDEERLCPTPLLSRPPFFERMFFADWFEENMFGQTLRTGQPEIGGNQYE
jgi:hypothetical protein